MGLRSDVGGAVGYNDNLAFLYDSITQMDYYDILDYFWSDNRKNITVFYVMCEEGVFNYFFRVKAEELLNACYESTTDSETTSIIELAQFLYVWDRFLSYSHKNNVKTDKGCSHHEMVEGDRIALNEVFEELYLMVSEILKSTDILIGENVKESAVKLSEFFVAPIEPDNYLKGTIFDYLFQRGLLNKLVGQETGVARAIFNSEDFKVAVGKEIENTCKDLVIQCRSKRKVSENEGGGFRFATT